MSKCNVNWHSCLASSIPSSSFGGDTQSTLGSKRRKKFRIQTGSGGCEEGER
jgi:hypothetical protein